MTSLTATAVDAVIDHAVLPDPVLRRAIRGLLRRRLQQVDPGTPSGRRAATRALMHELRQGPVAVATDDANDQHYEVPTELFEIMLGHRLKYSAAYWPPGVDGLDEAEDAMLRLTCQRAQIADGQDILELGCGWGSLTLWMAERYPGARITAVSNSATQREFIEKRARERDLDNVTVITRDINVFGLDGSAAAVAGGFDRVVSVEMFEHVRNHELLLARIEAWLRPGGKLFVHHFSNVAVAYPFETGGRADWMARHFFTGGLMPSDDWLLHVPSTLRADEHWIVDGSHYARTCEAWIERMEGNKDRILGLFADAYGTGAATAWFNRWRVFNLACAELFGYDGGRRWVVTHLRLAKG